EPWEKRKLSAPSVIAPGRQTPNNTHIATHDNVEPVGVLRFVVSCPVPLVSQQRRSGDPHAWAFALRSYSAGGHSEQTRRTIRPETPAAGCRSSPEGRTGTAGKERRTDGRQSIRVSAVIELGMCSYADHLDPFKPATPMYAEVA
ncbi:hypothetical protein MPH_05166, partial [Macrophomina phaseolina MS6]